MLGQTQITYHVATRRHDEFVSRAADARENGRARRAATGPAAGMHGRRARVARVAGALTALALSFALAATAAAANSGSGGGGGALLM